MAIGSHGQNHHLMASERLAAYSSEGGYTADL